MTTCQEKLADLRNGFAAHGLLLNATKTNLLIMKTNANNSWPQELELGGAKLKSTDSARFLGVQIDSNLRWDTHVEELKAKLHRQLFVIRRLSQICPRAVVIQSFHALIQSHIAYGITAWGGVSKRRMDSILTLQKQGLRHILGLPYLDSCRGKFRELNILTAPAMYIFKCIMLTHDRLGSIPIPRVGDSHNYPTRHRNEVRRERVRLVTCQKNLPRLQGLNFLHAIPESIQNLIGTTAFQTALKKYLIEKEYYSVHEGQVA